MAKRATDKRITPARGKPRRSRKTTSGNRTPTASEIRRREKLVELCCSLPEVTCKPYGKHHLCIAVGKKTFGYYLLNHHGDGIVAFCAKAAKGVQQRLVASDPARYCVPAYLGPSGWVSIRLDTPTVDWDDVLGRIIEAYRLQAPKRLLEQM